MTPPDKTIHFSFASHPTKDLKMRWKAKLTFPPSATDETPLDLALEDGEGSPVSEGTFEFAGLKLPVADGHASLTYAEFLRGKHISPLWLYRKDMLPIPGGMTFE